MEDNRKKINVAKIERGTDDKPDPQCYRIMDDLIGKYHPHLADARICLAWRYGWNPDADNRLKLGQCRKASDLDRDLHGYDFVILLNYEAWNAADFSAAQMEALIDHELLHAQITLDKETGEEKRDTQGRPVWRVRGHDVEEFHDIIRRHGFWTSNLETMARTAMDSKKAKETLFAEQPPETLIFRDAKHASDAVHIAEDLMALQRINPAAVDSILKKMEGSPVKELSRAQRKAQ